MTDVDWSRLAEPQADGYDTGQALWFAEHEVSPSRPQPYRRRPADGAPTLFEGQVAVRNRPVGGLQPPRYAPAAPDHPHLPKAAACVAIWPEMARQLPALVDTVQPWSDVSVPAETWLQVPGSSSHSEEGEFGVVMVTVDSPIATAQAMVHEMAHHKLRAFGVSLLSATRLVTNDPADLYVSPIITDRRRPMTAVLHAQYSFMHVTALDVAIYDGAEGDQALADQAVFLLARNVPRMERGYEEIARHIRTDDAGAAFVDAFMAWSSRVLARGREILDENGYGMPSLD